MTDIETLGAIAGVKQVLLLDTHGQVISSAGVHVDVTAFGALIASSIAAANAMASMLSDNRFNSAHYEGLGAQLLVTLIDTRAILVVHFESNVSPGFLRYRVRQIEASLLYAVEALIKKNLMYRSPLGDVTDAELMNGLDQLCNA